MRLLDLVNGTEWLLGCVSEVEVVVVVWLWCGCGVVILIDCWLCYVMLRKRFT